MYRKILITIAIASLLGFVSCNRGGGGKPLPAPGSPMPRDDGRVLHPGVQVPPLPPSHEDQGPGGGHRANAPKIVPKREVDDGGPGPNAPVPEPGTLLLFGTGLAGAALLRRRRRHAD